MPNIIRKRATIATNQKIPPLKKTQAACKKLKSLPNKTQEYAEEAHPIKITPVSRIRPSISSNHLSMETNRYFDLKRFLSNSTYVF